MINVAVIVLGISGERLLDPDRPIEGHVQITTNITVSDVEFKAVSYTHLTLPTTERV